ncbi:nucleotidyltransferase [Mobiluncus holmesii]|uniref:Nucleotidyltransferase n=2 Tax=Actinomycetaceae TaxID=2049 RepID=A0A7K0K2R0_9ACTO|nr:nucleotidyltransferase [Mobiluncus porci]
MQERLLRPLQEKPRETLKRNLDKVRAFLDCAHVTHPRVFGSVAQGEDRVDSDIDFLVVLPEGIGLMGKNRIREGLEDILGVPVDVVSDTPFTAGALDQARSEAVELGRIA